MALTAENEVHWQWCMTSSRNLKYQVNVAFCDRRKRRGEWLRGVFMKNNGWNVDRHVGYRRVTTSKWLASYFSPYNSRTDEREVLSTRASYVMRSFDKPGHVTRSSTVFIKYSAMDAPAQSVLMTWLNFMSLQSNTKTSRQVLKPSQAPVRYVPRVRYSGVTRLGL
jgi:hypothetical protein